MPRRATPVVLALAAASPLAFADAVQSGSTLTITTDDATQNITVDIVGTTATLTGVPNVADATAYTGVDTIAYTGGAGKDNLTINLDLTGSCTITVDTADGGSNISVQGTVDAGTADVAFAVLGGQGIDDVLFDLTADASALSVDLDFDSGDGASSYSAFVDAGPLSADCLVSFNGTTSFGADTIDLGVISTAMSAALIVDLDTNGRADDVSISFDQRYPTTVTAIITSDLGNNADVFNLDLLGADALADFTLLGQVRGQVGPDTLSLTCDTDLASFMTFAGNDGNDTLSMTHAGNLSGGPSLYGGPGRDTLTLRTDGLDLSASLMHGGPKSDTANGSAATIIGCETINP